MRTDHRAGIEHTVTSDLDKVGKNCAELFAPAHHALAHIQDGNLAPVAFDI